MNTIKLLVLRANKLLDEPTEKNLTSVRIILNQMQLKFEYQEEYIKLLDDDSTYMLMPKTYDDAA